MFVSLIPRTTIRRKVAYTENNSQTENNKQETTPYLFRLGKHLPLYITPYTGRASIFLTYNHYKCKPYNCKEF